MSVKSWVVDAADLDLGGMEEFSSHLLYMTREIEGFLESSHGTKVLVVAPRGVGKTLLLKAKRLSLQHRPGGIRLYPFNELVDKAVAIPTPISQSELDRKFRDYNYWRQVWLIALTFGCANYLRLDFGHQLPPLKSAGLNRIANSSGQTLIGTIFNQILAFTDSEYFAAVTDYNQQLISYFHNIKPQIATFIDNIDELFAHQVEASHHVNDGVGTHEKSAAIYRNIDRRVWSYAQIALARAIRDLHHANKHVKIYASIRSEAFAAMSGFEENGQQIAGSAVQVRYSKADLFEIFCRNIELMDSRDLVSTKEADPIARLVGKENQFLTHGYTGRDERFFDFVLRHTLYRPRDLMSFGERISAIDPKERSGKNIRDAVHDAGAEMANQYFGEVRPFVGLFTEDRLLRKIPANVMKAGQVEQIASAFNQEGSGADTNHPFCALYKAGLLGYPKRNDDGELVQEFAIPGSIRLDQDGILPRAECYIVHPALDEVINRGNPNEYQRNYNTINIVGRGLLWDETLRLSFACKGDIVGFSEIMNNPDYGHNYPTWFATEVGKLTRDHDFAEVVQGDSVLLVDQNARRLARTMRLIVRLLATHPVPRKIRFGACAGPIDVISTKSESGLPGHSGRAVVGRALRTAARLEPHAPGGHVVCTEQFALALARLSDGQPVARKAVRQEIPTLNFANGKFQVKKGAGSDPEEQLELWLINLEASPSSSQ